jgi:hypothetical protein
MPASCSAGRLIAGCILWLSGLGVNLKLAWIGNHPLRQLACARRSRCLPVKFLSNAKGVTPLAAINMQIGMKF